MCIMLYLASECPLPLVPWDEAYPGFHVTSLETNRHNWWEDWVWQQFTKPFVYSIGSYQGCACGFQFEGDPWEITPTIWPPGSRVDNSRRSWPGRWIIRPRSSCSLAGTASKPPRRIAVGGFRWSTCPATSSAIKKKRS